MSRILLAWELGGNYGHLSRLVPLARCLRSRGHQVLFAIRDTRLGAELCSLHGLPYVQSPIAHQVKPHRLSPANYAEILLCEGFADALDLHGRVEGWLNLYRAWSPDGVVIDHAPTALFSARLEKMPAVAISSGFEVPPDETPHPCIRPWEAIPRRRLVESEARVLSLLNPVARAYDGQPLETLADMFRWAQSVFTTFPELDHYGVRPGARYLGPISSQLGVETAWPERPGRRVFIYMRARVPGAEQLLRVLGNRDENVVCFMPDAPKDWRTALGGTCIHFVDHPVDIATLQPSAELVVTYGGSGMVNAALLAGVPMLLVPRNVEQYLTAKRVEVLGAGWVMEQQRGEEDFIQALEALLDDARYAQNARAFAQRHDYSPSAALDGLASVIESTLPSAACGGPPNREERGA